MWRSIPANPSILAWRLRIWGSCSTDRAVAGSIWVIADRSTDRAVSEGVVRLTEPVPGTILAWLSADLRESSRSTVRACLRERMLESWCRVIWPSTDDGKTVGSSIFFRKEPSTRWTPVPIATRRRYKIQVCRRPDDTHALHM